MSIQDYIEKFQTIQADLIDFIKNEDNVEENYQNLVNYIEEQEIRMDKHELKLFLNLLSKIADNYHRYESFFEKIEKIILLFKSEMKNYYTNDEIFNVFKGNKRVLLFLIEQDIISFDQEIFKELMKEEFRKGKYPEYFAPEFLKYIEQINDNESNDYNDIYNCILNAYNEDYSAFEEKRKKGKNNSVVCEMIQNDSIEEFITYVNREDYSLDSCIEESIFETNQFLIDHRKTTLIEYAAFNGSAQIFQYLFKNNAKLTEAIWNYAIHGDDAEIINFLEQKYAFGNDKDLLFELCINESIKCHHNHIANYIERNLLNNNIYNIVQCDDIFKLYNFAYFPKKMNDSDYLIYACKSGYYSMVWYLLENKRIDTNIMIIYTLFYKNEIFSYIFNVIDSYEVLYVFDL